MTVDNEYDEPGTESEGFTQGEPAYQLLCLYDSLQEMAGALANSWEEFCDLVDPDESGMPHPGAIIISPVVDRGGELMVSFALADQEDIDTVGVSLFQLSDDGYGPPELGALQHLLEECLEDYTPYARPVDWQPLYRLVGNGSRPVELRTSWGELLAGADDSGEF